MNSGPATPLPSWLDPVSRLLLEYWGPLRNSVMIVVLGFLGVAILSRLLIRPWAGKLSPQSRLVLRKAISYSLFVILSLMVLNQFHFNIGTILGAAGIAGIAIGFAAQTSLSNMISGFFLLVERPFQVGDVIRVDGHTGTVESVDLLALTMRTFDNLSIRIPNESLVRSHLTNITRHPIRRYDIEFGVAYREDVDHVLTILRDVADRNPHILVEPEPLVAITGFGESQLNFFLGVWHEKDDFVEMRNSILRDLKKRFAEEGIEIPYPHRVVLSPQQGLSSPGRRGGDLALASPEQTNLAARFPAGDGTPGMDTPDRK